MKVNEIMTKDVKSVSPDSTALDALKLLFEMEISGLPVIDSQGKLVGMFTEKDVLAHVLPSYIEQVGAFVYDENPKIVKKKFQEISRIKTSSIMRRDVVTVNEDATLCDVAKTMLIKKARRIPILDKSGKVIGIIARVDIVKALAKEAAI